MLIVNGCGTDFERDEHGSIISGGTIEGASVRTGDCFNDLNPEEMKKLTGDLSEAVELTYVSAVPCNMPHHNEVFATSESLFSVLDDYPSDEEFSTRVGIFCDSNMYKYLGIDTNLSEYEKENMFLDTFPEYYHYFFPLKSLWDSGSRKVSCLLYSELARENSARNLLKKRY